MNDPIADMMREDGREIKRLRDKLARCESALKLAHRHVSLGDPDVGSQEVGEAIMHSLCEVMGDEGFQGWLACGTAKSWGDDEDIELDEDWP